MPHPLRVLFLALLSLGIAGTLAALPPAGLPATQLRPEVQLAGPAPQVFERLGTLFGVRVKVDPDLPARSLDLRLRNTDFAAALQVAAVLSQAIWVVQPDGTVLVAADTPEKRELLLPQVEKTFSLSGRSLEELNDAVRLLRELLDMRRIRPDPRSSTFAVFDTPYRLAVAEELLAQLPDDPGEVFVEVQILEVDRERALDVGLATPDRAVMVHLGAGALVPSDLQSLVEIVQFLLSQGLLPEDLLPAALRSVLAGGIVDPNQVAALLPPFIIFGGGGTSYAAHLPGAELRLRQLARVTRFWRRLSLRSRSGQEATLFVGERFPIIFTTFSTIFVPQIVEELIRLGQFVPPVPAVRYEDLGVKVTLNPRVHPAREITLTLKIDQTALTAQEVNGIPVIASRVLEQQVRLKEGETLLIAGLRGTSTAMIHQGFPGLRSLPWIGSLFGRTVPTTRTNELLILVTPRLTRLPPKDLLTARALYVGTEKDFAPVGPAPAPEPAAAPPRPQPPPPQPQPPPPGQPPPARPFPQPPQPEPQPPQPPPSSEPPPPQQPPEPPQ